MEDSSPVKVLSRKRKKAPPSNAVTGVQTRSKSRIYCHHIRSGISRSDPFPTDPFCFPEVNRTDASAPDISSVNVNEEEASEEGKELLRSPTDAAPGLSTVLDLGAAEAKVDEVEKSGITPLEAHGDPDTTNGPTSRDDAGNSSGESKTAFNRCRTRKVFKAPSSFSYRRLLPYLTGILNDDDSSVPKIEIVDAGRLRKLQKLDGVNSNSRSLSGSIYTTVIEHFVPHFDDRSLSNNGEVPKLREKVLNLSGSENELGKTEEIVRPVEVEQRCNENGVNISDATAADCCQNTPPEPDIATKTKFGCGDSIEVNNKRGENQDFKGLSIGSEKSGNCVVWRQSSGEKPCTNSTNRSVLNPCSQLMLFKNPGSLSYRRLLPFLMDISKNNTAASKKVIQSPVPRVDTKEELLPVSAAGAEQNCENSQEKQHTENPIKQPSDDSSVDSNARLSPSMPNLSNNYSTNFGPSSVTSETLTDLCGTSDPQAEVIQQPQSANRKLDPCFDWENSSPLPPPSTMDNGALNEECTSNEHGNAGMHSYAVLELQNNNKELVHKVHLDQGSFHSGVPEGLVTPINGPSKGILKRNRLGCRGLCNCLNCSSFRLHADRAFEFSRNQMHDAEEVASELMKELANLCNLLKKSVRDDNALGASQLNPALINVACNRAMEAETLAKERLSQLKDDLNVHCRIPVLLQPRVTFANHIEERASSVLDTSSMEKKS